MPDRIDQIEKQRRITAIKEWILSGWDTYAIVMQGTVTWKVAERQVYRYIADAVKQFQQEGKRDFEKNKARHLAGRQRLLRNLKTQETPKGARTALAIWDSIARIEGVLKDHVEHDVKVTKIKVIRKEK